MLCRSATHQGVITAKSNPSLTNKLPIQTYCTTPKAPVGKRKGPITWKSLSYIAIGGSGFLGFMWYLRDEKERGTKL